MSDCVSNRSPPSPITSNVSIKVPRMNFSKSLIKSILEGRKTATTRLADENDHKSDLQLIHAGTLFKGTTDEQVQVEGQVQGQVQVEGQVDGQVQGLAVVEGATIGVVEPAAVGDQEQGQKEGQETVRGKEVVQDKEQAFALIKCTGERSMGIERGGDWDFTTRGSKLYCESNS